MKFVEFNNRSWPVSLNMAAFLEAETYLDMPLTEILERISLGMGKAQMIRLMYLGLKFGADEAGMKFPRLTYSEFVNIIDANDELAESLSEIIAEDMKAIFVILGERVNVVEPEKKPGIEPEKKTEMSGHTTSS